MAYQTARPALSEAELVSTQLMLIQDDPQGEYTSFPREAGETDGGNAARRLLASVMSQMAGAESRREGNGTAVERRMAFLDGSILIVRQEGTGENLKVGQNPGHQDAEPQPEREEDWNLITAESPEANAITAVMDASTLLLQGHVNAGTVLRFETSIGILTEPTRKGGHDPMSYRVTVQKNGRPLPESSPRRTRPERLHQTWAADKGMGAGSRDLEVALYLHIGADETISRTTFHSRFHEYRVAVYRQNQEGKTEWQTTVPFDLGRHELTGG